MKILHMIVEQYPEDDFMIATGFDDAVIGVDEFSMRIIYSMQKCIDILMQEGMSEEDAEDYFDYNVAGAYIGDKTPIWSFP
jgi:hypothetical protein